MSAPITVPVVNHSTGVVWFGDQCAGRVEAAPDTRYWSANPHGTDEYMRFNSKKAAIAYLVERVQLALGGLATTHYRRFGVARVSRSLAPLGKEYDTWADAKNDTDYPKPPQAALACRNVLLNGEPRILVHHPKQGVVTYEGTRGFRPLPAGAAVEPR